MEKLNTAEKFLFNMFRKRNIEDDLLFNGQFFLEHFRNGKRIGKHRIKNLVTNGGKNYLLDVGFNGIGQVTTWYLGLIDSASYTGEAAGDTMNSHAGWDEWIDYDETTRPVWNKSSSPTGTETLTTVSQSVFTINSAGSLQGGFVCANNVIGGTTGILWSAGHFGAAVPVGIGDQMRLGYQVSMS